MAAAPASSLPHQCGSWADLKAAYRLLSNGDGSIGELVSGLQWEYAGCPEDSYYTGMYARAGWLLDRLHPFCRYED